MKAAHRVSSPEDLRTAIRPVGFPALAKGLLSSAAAGFSHKSAREWEELLQWLAEARAAGQLRQLKPGGAR